MTSSLQVYCVGWALGQFPKLVTTMQTTKKVVYRSSVKGQFVTPVFAAKHPRETEREVVRVPVTPPPKKNGR